MNQWLLSEESLPQFIDKIGRDSASGSSQRMSQSDGATVDVRLFWIQTQRLLNRQELGSESLVDLDVTEQAFE